MARELEPWGGEVHLPRWLRRVLRLRPEAEDTPQRAHEGKRPQSDRTVLENTNRAATGAVVDLYKEGRDVRRRGATGRRGD